MTEALQVVARFKNGGFSRSASITELLASITEALPVDKIYFVIETDGVVTLREAGVVVLDVEPLPQVAQDDAQASQVGGAPSPSTPPTFSQPRALQALESRSFKPLGDTHKSPKAKKVKKASKKAADDLPVPPRSGGRTEVTGFTEATPAEAAAASMFGRS